MRSRIIADFRIDLGWTGQRLSAALIALLVLGFAGAHLSPAWAQGAPANDLSNLDKYWDYESASNPQISPDGSQIIYTRVRFDKQNDRRERNLWIMNADGGKHRFLIKGGGAIWSPDGTRIAYTGKGDDGKPQIFVRWMDAEGAISQISHTATPPRNLKWSPDGDWIAFRAIVPDRTTWKIDMPRKPRGAKWAEPPRIVDQMSYRQDRVGFQPVGYNHLFVVPADGGVARQITHGKWHVGRRQAGLDSGVGLSWTPDGGSLMFDGIARPSENRTRESHINIVSVDSGDIRQVTSAKGSWSSPVISPDGKTVLYTGHDKQDQSWTAGDIWAIDIDGSDPRQLTKDSPDTPNSVKWARDGKGAYYNLRKEGSVNLHYVSTGGDMRTVTTGVHVLNTSSIDDGTTAVATLTSPTEPPDVVTFSLRKPKDLTRLTNLNADLLHGVDLAGYEEVWYDSSDDTRVQGWIVTPPDFDAAKKYPLMLIIHGGPHAMYDVRFRYGWQNFAANGYVVIATNPRGSTGYGTDFGNAIHREFPGRRDFDDLMAGVDAVVERGYVDTDRIYIEGCSGGGILGLWAIAHTDRFAAASSRCPVTDWISIIGTSDMLLSPFSRFEVPYWEDPSSWIERSPLFHVGKVNTPTLLMSGVRDARTPISQAEQYYAALKIRGIPTRLVRMNDEWHGTGRVRPTNFMRTQLYIMSWWEMWTKEGRTASRAE